MCLTFAPAASAQQCFQCLPPIMMDLLLWKLHYYNMRTRRRTFTSTSSPSSTLWRWLRMSLPKLRVILKCVLLPTPWFLEVSMFRCISIWSFWPHGITTTFLASLSDRASWRTFQWVVVGLCMPEEDDLVFEVTNACGDITVNATRAVPIFAPQLLNFLFFGLFLKNIHK